MWIYWRLFLIALRLTGRRRRDLVLENLVLRQQLAVWERTGRHPTLAAADRRFWSVTARHWRGGASTCPAGAALHRGRLAPDGVATLLGLEEPRTT